MMDTAPLLAAAELAEELSVGAKTFNLRLEREGVLVQARLKHPEGQSFGAEFLVTWQQLCRAFASKTITGGAKSRYRYGRSDSLTLAIHLVDEKLSASLRGKSTLPA